MRRLVFCTLFLVALAAALAARQAPAGAPRPGTPEPAGPLAGIQAARGTARVAGRITRADTGAPLRGVRLVLSGNVLRQAVTDDQGRYEFTQVPAGRYTLQVSHAGYVTLNYGQRRAFEPGRPIALAEGQVLEDVDVALPRGAVLTGRITDDLGEPVTGAEIRVERYQYGPGGRQLVTFPLGFALGPTQMMTNDLGEYRIFGLMPGEYVVSARLRQGWGAGSAPAAGAAPDAAEGYLPTYYPGTVNVADAQPVRVGISQEVAAHFAVVPGRMVRISGTVTNSIGRPAAGLGVRLVVETATSSGPTGGTVVAPDGSFTIGNVAPGDYRIRVQPQAAGPDAEVASLHLTVGTEDVNGLRLVTTPGTTIRGLLEWEGSSSRPAGTLRVDTTSAEWPRRGPTGDFTFTYLDPENGTVNEDQTFERRGAIGALQFRLLPPPSEWAIKAVLADGRDIIDTGADATELDGDTRVRIVLTDRIAEISGTARDTRGQPVTDYVAVLLPEQELPGGTGIRYTRTVRPDQNGQFMLRALPPGRYVAAAVGALEQGGEWSPDLQERVRSAGTRFTVAEGQILALELELLP